MKTTYQSFGRGVAVRFNRSTDRYEVLCRGQALAVYTERRAAYDHAESLLTTEGGE